MAWLRFIPLRCPCPITQLVKANDQVKHLSAASSAPPGMHGVTTSAPSVPSTPSGGGLGGRRVSGFSDVGDSASVRMGVGDVFSSDATREYLKNILLRYMASNDPQVAARCVRMLRVGDRSR
jgi:hypothetical protein